MFEKVDFPKLFLNSNSSQDASKYHYVLIANMVYFNYLVDFPSGGTNPNT